MRRHEFDVGILNLILLIYLSIFLSGRLYWYTCSKEWKFIFCGMYSCQAVFFSFNTWLFSVATSNWERRDSRCWCHRRIGRQYMSTFLKKVFVSQRKILTRRLIPIFKGLQIWKLLKHARFVPPSRLRKLSFYLKKFWFSTWKRFLLSKNFVSLFSILRSLCCPFII